MMPTTQEKIAILEARNPFASARAGEPWEGRYPDVPGVNDRAFQGICRLLEQKARHPTGRIAGIILGETGQGKTHLIGRLLEYTRTSKVRATFAYIQPIEDPERTYRYLLREVVINLLHAITPGAELTQIGRLLAEIIKEFLDKGLEDMSPARRTKLMETLNADLAKAFQVTINRQDIADRAIAYLSGQYPALSRDFLKVLFQYRFPAKRPAVMSWLKGEVIDDDHAGQLGVRIDAQASEAAQEHAAIEILRSLGLLLERFQEPMVVCFDRLENLDSDGKLQAFQKMVDFLTDRTPAVLPLAFFRGDAWDERFSKKIEQHVTKRLEMNRFDLEGCTTEQALGLIRSRLAFAYGADELRDLEPLDEAELRAVFGRGSNSPGNIIALANARITAILDHTQAIPETDPIDALQEAYETHYQAILTDPDLHAPDRGRLRAAIEGYLANTPPEAGWSVAVLERGAHNRIDLVARVTSTGKAFPCAFIIDNEPHHLAVLSALEAGIAFLEETPGARAVYIRDGRNEIPRPPKWATTNARVRRFKERGGAVVTLDLADAARWYALALVRYAVKEGDVTTVGVDHRLRKLVRDEMARFIAERVHGGRYRTCEDLDRVLIGQGPRAAPERIEPAPRRPDEIGHAMLGILRDTPAKMMHSARLTEALGARIGPVTVEGVLAAMGQRPDRFVTIQSRDGVLVMVRREWLDAQG